MPELIVNADDFGLHSDIDKGIVLAIDDGLVNSISVVPRHLNMDLLNRLVEEEILVGAHVTLVELPWLTQPYFFQNWQAFMRSILVKGKPTGNEIEAEVRHQIEELLNRGIVLSHIDSHQHVHAFPKIWNVFRKVGEEFAIPRIRWSHAPKFQMMRRSIGGFGLQLMTTFAQKTTIRTIPSLGIGMGGANDFHVLSKELQMAGNKQDLELILHPGVTSPDLLKKYGHWGFDWDLELRTAQDSRLREFIDQQGFQIRSK